jgi:peptidoglycan/LPS O-acetylase OafA/YrhL
VPEAVIAGGVHLSSITLGAIVFVCLFGAALIGILIRNRLPSHHLDSESKDVIRLSTAVVGTLSALALGLLIASANTVYNNAEAEAIYIPCTVVAVATHSHREMTTKLLQLSRNGQ